MPSHDIEAELARLSAEIAEGELRDDDESRWAVIRALNERAEWLREAGDLPAALEGFREALRRLDGFDPKRAEQRRIWYTSNLAGTLHDLRESEEARAVAAALVEQHFDEPRDEFSSEAVGMAACILAELLGKDEEYAAARDLLRRVLDRYADLTTETGQFIRAMALTNLGAYLGAEDRSGEALEVFAQLARELEGTRDPELRILEAGALMRQASSLSVLDRENECIAVCLRLLRRFRAGEDPEIDSRLEWARETVALLDVARPRRRPLLRRGGARRD